MVFPLRWRLAPLQDVTVEGPYTSRGLWTSVATGKALKFKKALVGFRYLASRYFSTTLGLHVCMHAVAQLPPKRPGILCLFVGESAPCENQGLT